MGCRVSKEQGLQFSATKYKVGDRVALKVERRQPSDKFPGTFCTKSEVDVGKVLSVKNKSSASHSEIQTGRSRLGFGGYNYVVEYHVKFAHGGDMRVDESLLWAPSEDDEACAEQILIRPQ